MLLQTKFDVICSEGQIVTMLFADRYLEKSQIEDVTIDTKVTDVFTIEQISSRQLRFTVIRLDEETYLINTMVAMRPPISILIKYSDFFQGLPRPIDHLQMSAQDPNNRTIWGDMTHRYMMHLITTYEQRFKYYNDHAAELNSGFTEKEFVCTYITREFYKQGVQKIYYTPSNDHTETGFDIDGNEEEDDGDDTEEIDESDDNIGINGRTHDGSTYKAPKKDVSHLVEEESPLPIMYPPIPFGGQSSIDFGVGKGNQFGKSTNSQPYF